MKAVIALDATCGEARVGSVTTARGNFATPAFMPVGTRGTVRGLGSDDLDQIAPPVVLANTYHLMLRPGSSVVRSLGGLNRFMSWSGHTLTDSGGYQVFSLGPKVDEEGATFKSTYDGSYHPLTPESAARIQAEIGADIQMVLDICPALPSAPEVLRDAVERTVRWAERGRIEFETLRDAGASSGLEQSQFGIVQGGVDPGLRTRSARHTASLGFDGYAVGGLSVGESRAEMLPALAAALAELPPDQPRYLMGVGDPASLVEAIALGVDMFDCVLPTRLARHGTLLTDQGRLNLKRVGFAESLDPVDPTCDCPTCQRYSRGYLRHLLQVGELSAARLLSIHNITWLQRLVDRTAQSVRTGTLESWRSEVLDIWG